MKASKQPTSKQTGERLSLAQHFTKVTGLGKELLIALAVKGINSPELMARRVGMAGKKVPIDSRPLFEPIRKLGPEAPIFLAQAQHFAQPDKRLWEITGTESRDLVFHGDIAIAVISQTLIVYNANTGEEIKRINHPEFKLIHTVDFHPSEPDIILVSCSGVDRIVEINVQTGKIVTNWFAWDHGFNKNHFGMTLIEKGQPLPASDENTLVLSTAQYLKKFSNQRFGELDPNLNIYIEVDTYAGDENLGLENVFHTVHPNWAGYSIDGSKILATFLATGQAAEIDRATGKTRIIAENLGKPHGLVPYQGGYLLSDSSNGQVIYLDNDYQVINYYEFFDLPFDNGDNFPTDWIQLSHGIGEGKNELIATIDSRRAIVIIWDPNNRTYSTYPFEPKWLVQAALPVPANAFGLF